MSFINPNEAFPPPNVKKLLLDHYKGKQWTSLPTPSLYVDATIVNSNVTKMLNRIKSLGTRFRAHVKTHKTIEGARKQLGYDLPNYSGPKYDSIVVSTLKEAWSIAKYQKETNDVFVKSVIYGLPNITEETLEQIVDLQTHFDQFILLIDSLDHIEIIKEFSLKTKLTDKFNVIVKLDNGTHRAGILDTGYLSKVIKFIIEVDSAELYGFYVHSGHSYSSSFIEEAEERLLEELETVNKGFKLLSSVNPEYDLSRLTVSVGATPTLHSLDHHLFSKTNVKIAKIISEFEGQLELHAGNYTFCDLQQVSTGCIDESNVAIGVIGTVISKYPNRNNSFGEQLTNTGVISLSRETASKYPGFGLVNTEKKYGQWKVDRVSQEHGVLAPIDINNASFIPIGTKIRIVPNHACITANSYNAFYVLNKEGIVEDVWIPWRGW